MPEAIAPYVPVFMLVSSLLAALTFALALVAFRRTSRFQDVDYKPHVTIACAEPRGEVEADRDEDDEEHELNRNLKAEVEGTVTNAGPKPVRLTKGRVTLGPRHRDDPEHALTVPFFKVLGTGDSCPFSFSLCWATIWDVADHFKTTSINCHLILTIQGGDGITREVNKFIGTAMKAEGNEWMIIPPHYFLEVLNDLQQAKLRQRLNPNPLPRPAPVDPDIPF